MKDTSRNAITRVNVLKVGSFQVANTHCHSTGVGPSVSMIPV